MHSQGPSVSGRKGTCDAAAERLGDEGLVSCADPHGFTETVGRSLMASYLPIADTRRALAYSEAERRWQLLRRGRYLEFNLLYDRGVKFGLDGGRVESIMVSAPPLIAWEYNVVPDEGSREAELLRVLAQPRSWA
jgi:coproporphyrinogen III oxidase